MPRFLYFVTALLISLSQPAMAEDISAGTMGGISDLLGQVSADHVPQGADPATYKKAIEALKAEKLTGLAKPVQPGDMSLLSGYGKALLLGTRTAELAAEIGKLHDAVIGGQPQAIEQAIIAIYLKANRPEPKGEALANLVAAARAVGGEAPTPTARHVIERPDYKIEIVDAVAAGNMLVDVTIAQGPDGKPVRVLFEGQAQTKPRADGKGLERQLQPKDPCVMTAKDAADLRQALNGDWQAGDRKWAVAGDGEQIILTETDPKGHQNAYQGTYRLGKIEARHAITDPADMGDELPIQVRSQLAGMGLFFTLRLETCKDAENLKGVWGSQHVTYGAMDYQVSSVHDPYDQPIHLSRKREHKVYHIASLNIDYGPWEQKQRELRAELALAEDDERRKSEELTQALDHLAQVQERGRAALRATVAAKADWEAAERRRVNFVPGDDAKSRAYRDLERRRNALQRRADMLYEGIMLNRGHYIADAAFENYERYMADIARMDAELARMGKELGFDRMKADVAKAAEDAFVAHIRAETEMTAAGAAIDVARARADRLEVELLQAREKASAAAAELARFDETSPRIGGVKAEEGATVKYETTIWDPSELLAFLDREIEQLGRVLRQSEEARRSARAEFLSAQQEASYRQLKLAEGIMHSAIAQGLTETVFNALDVLEKTAEAGPIGALGEGAKKMVEAAVLGPPSFYEPSLAPYYMTGDGGPFSDIKANAFDALKYSAKRGFKSVVTGPAAGLVVKKYIETKSMRVYLELINEAVQGSMETGYRIAGPSQGARAVEAFEKMMKAREGFAKAVKEGLFRNFGNLAGNTTMETLKNVARQPQVGKLAHSVGRDLAKMATKKALAEWLEGQPLAEYMAAEAQARLATQIFLAASGVYWESKDPYEARVAERREVLRQYDPKNHMAILANDSFEEKAELVISLRDENGEPLLSNGHRATVKLGGKLAEPVPGTYFYYKVAATDLSHDGKGGVSLEIVMEE